MKLKVARAIYKISPKILPFKTRIALKVIEKLAAPVTEEKIKSITPNNIMDKIKPEIDWAVKLKLEKDVAIYFFTQIKENIENKSKLKEIIDSKHTLLDFSDKIKSPNVPKLKGYKWDTKKDINETISELEKIEEDWKKENEKEDRKWIKDSEEPKKEKLVEVNGNLAWWDLHTKASDTESRAMGHCGADVEAYTLLSLRESKKDGKETSYLPQLTFSITKDGHLLQMKGPHNAKPNKKYHSAILKLLKSKHVIELMGGSYNPESDFSLHDLEEGHKVELSEILKEKPNIDHDVTFKNVKSYGELLKILPEGDKGTRLRRKWVIKNNDKMAEEDIEEFVLDDVAGIHYILEPSEELQLKVVKLKPSSSIRLIRKPTEKVQLESVKRNGLSIQYLKNPSEEVQLAAVRQKGDSLEFIKNPSEEVQLEAVKQDSAAIAYIKNPSEAVMVEVVTQSPRYLVFYNNPSEEVQLAAVKIDGEAIKYIKNPTKKVKEEAARNNK